MKLKGELVYETARRRGLTEHEAKIFGCLDEAAGRERVPEARRRRAGGWPALPPGRIDLSATRKEYE